MTGVRAGRVRFVTFDVGGTLIHPYPSLGIVYAEVLNRRGFTSLPEEVGRAFEEVWEETALGVPSNQERFRLSPGGERGYWERLLVLTVKKLGGAEPPAGAAEELFERFGHRDTWRVFPDVLETLETLTVRAFPMGIVSNWDSRLPGLLRELGIRRYFGPILVSALEGYQKPDPRIFRLAAQRAETEVEAMLHVGDHLREDIEGARQAGCLAMRVERDGPGGGVGLDQVLEWIGEERSTPRGMAST